MTDTLFALPPPDFTADEWTTKEVTRLTAENWIPQYHYSGTIGTAGARFFGVFGPDVVCIVAIGPTSNAWGVATKFGLTGWRGNIEITRVAAHPDAPHSTPSRSVAAVCHLMRSEGWEWLFSYADTGQGHHGGIYQALNAVYVGISPARPGYLMDGVPTHPRTIVSRFGTQAWPACRELAAKAGLVLEKVEDLNTDKHTYILPIGGPAVCRKIRRTLAPFAKPYPKREP